MASIKKRTEQKKKRFLSFHRAATLVGCDTATISRKVKSQKIKGGLFAVYVKDEKGNFHETELNVKLVDTYELY